MFIGNVVRDPEVKYTPKGTAVCEISLAVNETYTKDGEKHEITTFIGVTMWGRRAEICGEYAKKGKSVYIEARATQDKWEDAEGKKHQKTKFIGEDIQLLGGGQKRQESDGDNDAPPQRPSRPAAPAPNGPAIPDDDDIPFAPNFV